MFLLLLQKPLQLLYFSLFLVRVKVSRILFSKATLELFLWSALHSLLPSDRPLGAIENFCINYCQPCGNYCSHYWSTQSFFHSFKKVQNCCCVSVNVFWEKIAGADVVTALMVITQGCDLSKLKILCALEQNPSVSWVNRLQTLSKHNSEPVICEGDLMNIWEPGCMVVCLFVFAV